MGRITRLAKVTDDTVGLDVNIHSHQEKHGSGQEGYAGEPLLGIIIVRGYEKNPAALHQGIECVEKRPHEDN